jgi:CheY-like chemotaxis protein
LPAALDLSFAAPGVVRCAPMTSKRRPRPQRAAPPLILVVDDDAGTLRLYAQFLKGDGFRVATAGDGLSAVVAATMDRPDLIVMDLSLPQVDGWEATRQIKRNPATARIPVVACTGHVLGGSVARALDAGVDAYITKPCPPAALARQIRKTLRRFGPGGAP